MRSLIVRACARVLGWWYTPDSPTCRLYIRADSKKEFRFTKSASRTIKHTYRLAKSLAI